MESARASFISKGTTPPIGWVYEIKHEGETFTFQAPMYLGLEKQLRAWHKSKELEWPGDSEMRARIEHYICQYLPKGFCKGGPDQPVVPFLSIRMIRDATRLIVDRLFRREEMMVPQEEANRRAKTCANCVKNVHGICVSCAGSELMGLFVWFLRQGRKTPYDQVLDVCTVCGCALRAKVHVALVTLEKLSKHTYPPNCFLYGTAAHVPAKDSAASAKGGD